MLILKECLLHIGGFMSITRIYFPYFLNIKNMLLDSAFSPMILDDDDGYDPVQSMLSLMRENQIITHMPYLLKQFS